MATLTTVLSLRKPDPTDFVSRANDLNLNWDALDALFSSSTGHSHSGAGTSGKRTTVYQDVEAVYDAVEAATLDTLSASSKLINNLNRVRYYITQVSGQALGTVGTSLNAHVTGTGTVHTSASFGFADGSVGVPSAFFSADTDTGLYRSGANNFLATTGGHYNTEFSDTTSAVNWLRNTNAATGAPPTISTQGSDVNISLNLQGKGFGSIYISSQNTDYFNVFGGTGVATIQSTGASVNVGLNLITKGAGNIGFYSAAGSRTIAQFIDVLSAVNYLQFSPNATGLGVGISALGSDAAIDLNLQSKGTGNIQFLTVGGVQFKIVNTASVVNTIQVTGAATGNIPSMQVSGTDANIGLTLSSKGTGIVTIASGGAARNIAQFLDIASSVNFLQFYPAATTGSPQVLAAGADTNVALALNSKGTGQVSINTGAGARAGFTVVDVASSVNSLQTNPAITGSPVLVGPIGSDTNIGLTLYSKGTGSVLIQSGQTARTMAQFVDVASSVNYMQITPAATGGSPGITGVGSDANVSLAYVTKASGVHYFNTGGGTQVEIVDTATAVNRIRLTGGATGNTPAISSSGTDANVGLDLRGKGTGIIYLGAQNANYLSVQSQVTGTPVTVTTGGTAGISFTKQYVAARVADTFSATPTIDWNAGNVHAMTLTGNITTLTLSNPVAGGRYLMVLTQDATGSRTVAWPGTVKWASATAPVLSGANKIDIIGFVWDGTNYYGSASLNY